MDLANVPLANDAQRGFLYPLDIPVMPEHPRVCLGTCQRSLSSSLHGAKRPGSERTSREGLLVHTTQSPLKVWETTGLPFFPTQWDRRPVFRVASPRRWRSPPFFFLLRRSSVPQQQLLGMPGGWWPNDDSYVPGGGYDSRIEHPVDPPFHWSGGQGGAGPASRAFETNGTTLSRRVSSESGVTPSAAVVTTDMEVFCHHRPGKRPGFHTCSTDEIHSCGGPCPYRPTAFATKPCSTTAAAAENRAWTTLSRVCEFSPDETFMALASESHSVVDRLNNTCTGRRAAKPKLPVLWPVRPRCCASGFVNLECRLN